MFIFFILYSALATCGDIPIPPLRDGDNVKNLLRITRLPLGLQSGWSLDRGVSDGDDVEILSDVDTRGPSGVPALLIRPVVSPVTSLLNAPMKLLSDDLPTVSLSLYSAPFTVSSSPDVHTASLYIRGADRGRLLVVCDGKILGQKVFDGRNQERWQRIEIPFKPVPKARAYGMRLEATGRFWIDALQVERGPVATEYVSQSACEVALAVDSPARVLFDDEKPELQFLVSGEPSNGALKAKLINLYGEEWMLSSVDLSRDFLQRGKLRFDDGRPEKTSQSRAILSERPFGAFRIEAWIENQRNERISPVNELVIYRLRRPHYWKKDAPASPFGTHTLSTTRHIQMAKAAGINWTRLHDAGTEYVGWYHLERNAREWTFFDKEIQRYRQHGMKILGSLSTTPEWASTLLKRKQSYFDRYYEPKRIGDFANYVKVVTKRYRESIGSWEIWNEPWAPQFWHTRFDAELGANSHGYLALDHPEDRYAEMMQSAFKTAKSVDKTLALVGINTSAGKSEWTQSMQERGGLNHCDVVSYHHYPSDKFDDAVIQIGFSEAVGPLADSNGRLSKSVWLTEGAPNSGSIGGNFYNHTLPYKDADDYFVSSDALCRYVVALLGQNVKKVFLYSMHTHTFFGAKSELRTLVTEEGYLHPSAAAHSALAWRIEDTTFERRAAINESVTAHVFKGKERAIAVLSKKAGGEEFLLPKSKDIELTDLFGNPLEPGSPLGRTLIYLSAKNIKILMNAIPALGNK